MIIDKLTFTGFKDIDAKLKTLPPKVAKKVIRQGIRKGQKVIEKETEALCPNSSGDLKRSVKIKSTKRSRVTIGMNVITDIKYGAAQEYGTRKIEGKGFMRRAFDTKADVAKELTMMEIANGLTREASK